MSDAPELPHGSTLIRTEPVQQRSSQRIALLLDVAAELVDELGIDGLTTSEVAARSGSSVGVVYRYFPNIQSLLRALAARNAQWFMEKVEAALAAEREDWTAALGVAIDAFVDMARHVPGFRALRFGDVIDERFVETELSNNAQLARAFTGMLATRYGFLPTDRQIFDFEVIIEIADALLQRAFLLERAGDERFIQTARDVIGDYVRTSTTLPGTRGNKAHPGEQ